MLKKVLIQPFAPPPDPLVRLELKVQATNVPVRSAGLCDVSILLGERKQIGRLS
jgi:hypothetical protein